MERFDFDYAPFNYLTPSERLALQKSVNIAFFHDHENIILPGQAIEYLYVVVKGLVKEIGPDGELVSVYHPRDTFEARGLIEGISHHQFTVEEEALVYTIPKNVVLHIIESNPRFGAYCYTSVADKFAELSHLKNESEFESLFTAKVRDAYRSNPVWLDGGDTVLQAAGTLKEYKTKSALVSHQGKTGLFTESSFRDIMIAGGQASDPIHLWTVFNLIAIDIDDFVFNALLRMTTHKIQRVVVLEHGIPIGTLEQIDILAYFSNHSHLVAQRLERAKTIDELTDIAAHMNDSVRLLRNNGVRAPQLAQLMQVLNTTLFEKAWRILAPDELYNHSCLIVMGSEGRGEQILKTDQDNALILNEQADSVLAADIAEQFSATLARMGYPPCAGRIMVNNAEWRRNLSDFKKTVSGWCRTPNGENMMKLAIFMDAKAVAGDISLLAEVKEYLQQTMINDTGMLTAFARAVEQFDSHSSGFFSQFLRRGRSEKMDIKKMGQFPIVHGIRALSLEARIEETNTFERIRHLTQLGILEENLGKDVAEALSYIMDLRLSANFSMLHSGSNVPNQVDFGNLSTLERDLLKDALQVVKRFKTLIRQHFHITS
ncbi:MAG: putative nucleotidyltransferase substrate binding domain-containing protein [Neisseria sp.]|nr:putative nucleotidyltransferase substrate binding domain-containing protein [Neisseria sp.]